MLLYAVILIKYSICLYINNGQLAIKQSLLQYKGEILYTQQEIECSKDSPRPYVEVEKKKQLTLNPD